MSTTGPPIFFVHIQKTAGGTLRHFIRSNLPDGAVYPEGGFDTHAMDSYWEIDRLRAITPERRAQIQAYVGHFPAVAADLVADELDDGVCTITVLRDPIERTISYCKMRSRDPGHEGMSFEDIYDDDFDFPCFIHNHQTKVFSMTRDDKLETFMDVIAVDEARLDIAKANLERIDIMGLQERSHDVLAAVADRYGWSLEGVEDQHIGRDDWSIPDSFRERIANDNAIDIELYRYACSLYEQRGGPERPR